MVIYIIDLFIVDTLNGKSLWIKGNILSSFIFFPDQIPKINILNKGSTEHPKAIEGRQMLIFTDILNLEEA